MAGNNARAMMGRKAKELFDQERYEEALEILDTMLAETPDDPRIQSTRDMVQNKWQEKVATAAKALRPAPALVTREISQALSDTFEDEVDVIVPATTASITPTPKPNGDGSASLDEAKQAARQALSGAAIVARNASCTRPGRRSRGRTDRRSGRRRQ